MLLTVWKHACRKKQTQKRSFTIIYSVLNQRPKFYGHSRRFKTFGYGYDGRSFTVPNVWLQPKVKIVTNGPTLHLQRFRDFSKERGSTKDSLEPT